MLFVCFISSSVVKLKKTCTKLNRAMRGWIGLGLYELDNEHEPGLDLIWF